MAFLSPTGMVDYAVYFSQISQTHQNPYESVEVETEPMLNEGCG